MSYKITDTIIVDQNKNIGSIGIASFSGPVIIGGGSSTGTLSQGLQLTGTGTPGAYISGNVGIGSTNPSSKLWVSGDIYNTGIHTAYVLNASKDPGSGIATDFTNSLFGNGWRLSAPASTTYYKLATLPAGGAGNTFDHLTINGVLGAWTNTNQTPFEIFFSNRGAFNYKYISYGTVRSDVRILGISTNSSIEIWAQHQASQFTKLVYNIPDSIESIVVSNPTSTTTAPTGTTVFDSSTATPRFIINESDNIGIGTTNPGSKLTVNGAIQIQQDSGSNNRFILRGQTASLYRWNIDNYGSANDFRIFREDDITTSNGVTLVSISTIGTLSATKFSGDGSLLTNISVGSSQWVTTSVGIHTLSNVGIGTTNPTSKLTVSGNVSITGILTADQVYTSNNGAGQNVRIGDDLWIGDVNITNTTRFSGAQDSTKAFIIFGTSDAVALGRTGSGPLYYGGDFTISGVATANSFRARGGAPGAIGVNNNGYGFFSPGDNDSGMYSSADGQIEFYSNSNEVVRIDTNQRVGIGSTNPGSKLSVIGDVYVSGVVTATSFYGSGANLTGIIANTATYASTAGIATYATSSGIATYATSSGIATYATSSGVATSVIGGIGSVTTLSVSGITTLQTTTFIGSGTSTGTANQILQVSGISSGAYIGGNLGIGSTNPGSKLSVIGDANISGVITASQLDLTASATTNDSVLYLSGTVLGTNTKNGIFGIGQLGFNDTDIIANFTHNVNSYAQVILQNINSGASASSDFIVNNDRTGGTTYYGDFGINGTTFAGGGPFGDPDGTYLYSSGGTLSLGSQGTNTVRIASNNIERITILSTGLVGIGSTNPTSKLDVVGDVKVSGVVTATSFYGSGANLTGVAVSISTNTTNTNQYIPYVTGTGNTTGFGVTTGFVFNPSSGNLGIGSTNPANRLTINATVVPTNDLVMISNIGFPAVTAGLNNLQIDYVGGAAAVEAGAARVGMTPGTTSGGTWNAFRILPTASATTGVVQNAVKCDAITAGLGTDNALWVGTGWDNIINYNNTSIINGIGEFVFRINSTTGISTIGFLSATSINTSSISTFASLRVTGAFYDSTNSPGTSGQVLQTTATGTVWTSSATAVAAGGKFDTTIDNSLFVQPTGTLDIVGVGTTTTQITTLPSGSNDYVIHSLHVTNVSNGDAEITAGYIINSRKVPATISVSAGSSGGPGIHTFTVGSASSITVGMAVTGTGNIGETTGIGSTAGFQYNTYVTSVDGNNITISKPMSGRATGVLYFSPVSKVASRLPVPVGSAVELLKQPMCIAPLDSIVLQSTGAGSGIGSTSTFAISQTANSNFLTVTAGAAITNFLASGMLIQPTGINTGIQTNTFVGVGYTPGALSIPMTRPATTSLASTSFSFTEVVVPEDGALQVSIVYQSSSDTSYSGGTGTVVGIVTLASQATSPLLGITSTVPSVYYGAGLTYPSIVQSIKVSNVSDGFSYPGGDYPVWVGIGNSDTVFSWLAYNMVIPKNSSIELCESPKRLGIGQSIFAYSNTPNAIEIQIAAKQKI